MKVSPTALVQGAAIACVASYVVHLSDELRRTQAHLSQYTDLDARPPTNYEWVDAAHEELQAMLEADDPRHEDSDESKKVREPRVRPVHQQHHPRSRSQTHAPQPDAHIPPLYT